MSLKQGIRILALDDSSFKKSDAQVLVVGIIGRQSIIEGLLSFKVEIDGDDATEKLLKAINRSRFKSQIKLIAVNGITFGGLNLIDIGSVSKALKIPVIAITRSKPHKSLLMQAISYGKGSSAKLAMLKKIRKDAELFRLNNYYIQAVNINKESLKAFMATAISLLRLSHIVASGISRGESQGRI